MSYQLKEERGRPRRALRGAVCTLVLAVASATMNPAVAQGDERVASVLKQAREALDEFKYDRAVVIANDLVDATTLATKAQRIEALQIIAAAQYPDDPQAARSSSALLTLRKLVKLDPEAQMPRALRWPGLDSLLQVARNSTLSISLTAPDSIVVRGPAMSAALSPRSTRRARWTAELLPTDGGPALVIPVDDRGTVTLRALVDGRPAYTSREGRLRMTAIDAERPDTERVEMAVHVVADALTLDAMPAPFDSTRLLPTFLPPSRARTIVTAALLGGVTFGVASGLRGSAPLTNAPADGQAPVAAAVLAIGAIAALYLDHGVDLPDNRAANQQVVREYDRSVQETRATNDRRILSYTVHFYFLKEQP